MRKKIIFLDVNGTLTDYENHIPASAAEAIRKARANGHRVYLCTGRSRAEIYDELWAIGLDGMIGGNGCATESEPFIWNAAAGCMPARTSGKRAIR